MTYPQAYLDDILVRMAHHSSAIEGNTITLPETVSIILENTLPGQKGVREFYEIDNHKEAFRLLLSMLDQHSPLTISFIQDIHAALMDRLQHDKGQFKTTQNAIIGAEFQTATPAETPQLIRQWVDNTTYRLDHSTDTNDILTILADTHIQFERIHPFSDGNGRTGRMILMYLSMQYLGTPIIINKNTRALYIQNLAEQNITALANIFGSSLTYEKERKTQFQ